MSLNENNNNAANKGGNKPVVAKTNFMIAHKGLIKGVISKIYNNPDK